MLTGSKKSASNGVETTHLCVYAYQGFYARPEKDSEGALNLLAWEAGIPGKESVRNH